MSQLQAILLTAEPAIDAKGHRSTPVIYLRRTERAGGEPGIHARPSTVRVISISEAWTDSDSLAAVSAASVAAAVRVFAAIVASVAGAAAPPAAFSLHWHSVASVAGVPAPAFAAVSVVPDPASRRSFPVAADISGPALGCLYWEHRVAPRAEGREHGRADGKRCCSPLDSPDGSPDPADFRHDWRAECKAPLPLWPEQRRDR